MTGQGLLGHWIGAVVVTVLVDVDGRVDVVVLAGVVVVVAAAVVVDVKAAVVEVLVDVVVGAAVVVVGVSTGHDTTSICPGKCKYEH
jgi:hypothetical protein